MKIRFSFRRFPLSCIRYSLVALAALPHADAVSYKYKANNNDDLSSGTSWTLGIAPSSTDRAYFGSTITGAITSAIGGDMAIDMLWISGAGGDITINGTAGKSLTVYSGGINMNSATHNLNLNGLSYVLGLGQTWGVAAGMAITADASTVISGAVATDLNKSGGGTLTLNGHNTFLGNFNIMGGTVNLGHATDTLDDSITVYLGNALSTLAIGANSDTVKTVQGVSGASITGSTGTLSASSSFIFAGNTVSAQLGGAASVSVTGNSVLSGVNSYTGGTTIATDKSLTFSNGSLGSTGAITVNGELIWATGNTQDLSSRITASTNGTKFNTNGNDVTFDSAIGGSTNVDITKKGTGTLTLNGSNSYTGLTTISAGTLKIGNVNALGTTQGGVTISDGATLDVNGTNTGDSIYLAGTGVGANGALINSNTGTAASLSNSITLANSTSVGGAGDLTLNGQVSNGYTNYRLTKVGTGALTLGYANSTTTPATVSAGTLKFGARMPVGNVTVSSGATLDINGFQTLTPTLSGTGVNGNGALQNNGGAVDLSWGVTLAADASIGGTGDYNCDGPISGAYVLTKTGTGTLTISSDNHYGFTGGTTVSAGTLLVSNTSGSGTGTGTVTVNSGATLGGTGTIAGDVNVAGMFAPGASIGRLMVGGDLSFATGSTFAYEMNSSVDKTLAGDLLIVNGGGLGTDPLAIGAHVALTLTDLAGGKFAANTTLSLIQYAGQWNSGIFTYGANELTNGEAFADSYGNKWTIRYDASGAGDNFSTQLDDSHFITLSNISAIPEPGSLLGLAGLLSSAMCLRSRRGKRVA